MRLIAALVLIVLWRLMADTPTPHDDKASPHYYEAEILPEQRFLILDALRAYHAPGKAAQITECDRIISTAKRIGLPLLKTGFDWDELEAEAQRQRCSVVDLIWDMAGRAKGPT